MNPARGHSALSEMSRGLRESLAPVLEAQASVLDVTAARDVAELLMLHGLTRVLTALLAHAGARWPAALDPALDRLRRLRDTCTPEETLDVFQAADRELAGYATEIEAIVWHAPASVGGGGGAVPTIDVAEVLVDLPVGDSHALARAREVRVSAPAGAAVRASLDWLIGAEGARRPLHLSFDPSCVELRFAINDPAGLMPASEVLSAFGGNLGPAWTHGPGTGDADWIMRVPAIAEKESYLTFEQGDLRLAVPWHSVLRVSLDDDETASIPRLARLGGAGHAPSRPSIVVGWGIKRATLAADRLVWRLQATATEPGEPEPAVPVTGAVRSEDEGIFWVVDLSRLMADVPLPPVPESWSEPETRERKAKHHPPEPEAAEPSKHEKVEMSPAVPQETLPVAPRTLSPANVVPITWKTTTIRSQRDADVPKPRPSGTRGRTALIAEDSLTARIFLSRLLQAHGFEVRAVDRAADLMKEMAERSWALVCVDVELPDARGAALVREAAEFQAAQPAPAALVALVRDRADMQMAAEAGVHRTLRKPYAPEELVRVLERIHLAQVRST